MAAIVFETPDPVNRFLAAWQDWRGAQIVPSRALVRLEMIPELLQYITIVDAAAPDRFMFRLSGTAIDRVAGNDLTGVDILQLTAPSVRPIRARRMWAMADHPCGCLVAFLHRYPSGIDLPAMGLTLPVRPTDPAVPMQLWTLFWRNRKLEENGTPVRNIITDVPDRFAFVDIGAGAPAQDDEETVSLSDLENG